MSTTDIYAVTKKSCNCIGKVSNAHRGAMYVWNDIAKRYFNLDGFPLFDREMQRRVWNAENEHELPKHEEIVLAATMDRVTVKQADIKKLTDAFDKYGYEHPNSSISEQSKIINSYEFKPDELLAFNQTSASEFQFEPSYSEDDEEEYSQLESAWDLFEQLS